MAAYNFLLTYSKDLAPYKNALKETLVFAILYEMFPKLKKGNLSKKNLNKVFK